MNNKKFELVKSMNTIVTANSNFLEQMAKNRTQIKIRRKTMGIAWELKGLAAGRILERAMANPIYKICHSEIRENQS